MVLNKCVRCGNLFKTSSPNGRPREVDGCSKCTKIFGDGTIEGILEDFKKW